MGFEKKQIIPFVFVMGLWERWKKIDVIKLWTSSQTNEHIKIVKDWYIEGTTALCIVTIKDLLGYDFYVSTVDLFNRERKVEIWDLTKNIMLTSFSAKDNFSITLDEQSLLYMIKIHDAVIGIPWVLFDYRKSEKRLEAEKIKLGCQLMRVYSLQLNFPYYDEDYTVLSRAAYAEGYVLDVGANYGQSMLAFYKILKKSLIISIEVRPDLYDALIQLKKWVDADNRVTVINSGISSKEEELVWYEPSNPYISGSFDLDFIKSRNLNVEIHTQNLKCRPLDDIIVDKSNIWFIKMDVEGLEYEALQGAKEIIETNYPAILIEQNKKLDDIRLLLNDKYDVYYYDLYKDIFVKQKASSLNFWLIPKEKFRNQYINQMIMGRIQNGTDER